MLAALPIAHDETARKNLKALLLIQIDAGVI
jgi:hypothetical protein